MDCYTACCCAFHNPGSLHHSSRPVSFLSAAQAEVLTPQEVPAFIDVTLAFLEHCNWHQVTIAPKHRE